ncbi:hypothetical protein [Treponema sp. R80B11-R83G3]
MRYLKFIAFICFNLIFLPQFVFSENYYTGNGGSAIMLIIIKPTGEGLPKEDEFVLGYIQNLLVANFKKYTAVKTNAQETASGVKIDAAFLLAGKLTRSGNNYIMELTVTDTTKGLRKASYQSTSIRPNDILNAQAINTGFVDIAKKLDIQFTDAGLAALKNPSKEEVQAAINLARGKVAEKNDNPIEMLTYLYNASTYDPSLLEATSQFQSLSSSLASGDAGASVKGDLKERDKWLKILNEFDSFYETHPPFILSYDPLPLQKGNTDYDNRTAVLQFRVNFQEDVSFEAMQKVYVALKTGLINTKLQEQWGFMTRPYRSPLFDKTRTYNVSAELVNNRNQVVASTNFKVKSRITPFRNALLADTSQIIHISFKAIHADNDITEDMVVRVINIDGINTEKAMQQGYVRVAPVEELPKAKARSLVTLLTRK